MEDLPGINFKPNFLHYSGFLQAAPTRYFHYWLTRHQYATSTSPVILWLNGGPGCSSLGGLIEELGPFHVKNYGNTVYENVYAWNKVGHVLFLESPAGVGFSYATDGNITTDDDQVAKDNYNSLVYFFQYKFPELKNNDFYITGESYGGVYVPTLAVLVANDKSNFPNFKGIAIGNGLFNFPNNYNTIVPLYYYHMLMRQNLYDTVAVQCCNGNTYGCDYFSLLKNSSCRPLILEQLNQADELDPYNLYSFCYLDGGPQSKRNFIFKNLFKAAGISPHEIEGRGAALPLCEQVNNTEVYLNRADVRTALHIPSNLPYWTDCSDAVSNVYNIVHYDMSPEFQILIQKGIRVLIYNGDVDTVCNGVMNKQFLAKLGLNILGTNVTNGQAWYYTNEDPNVAGYITQFSGNLDFVTVRGSGHFVPEDKPKEALQLIYNFIAKTGNYSLPIPFSTDPQPIINQTIL
uniref:Carboxypeptidase n=1 Tax=Acrobeloides nanus TaxID=290746 RepID=A0A914EAF0_9BILA